MLNEPRLLDYVEYRWREAALVLLLQSQRTTTSWQLVRLLTHFGIRDDSMTENQHQPVSDFDVPMTTALQLMQLTAVSLRPIEG
jgi:hypothetical protein